MKRKSIFPIPLFTVMTMVAGCAAKPEKIEAELVSHEAYLNWGCGKLEEEQSRLVYELSTASDEQRKHRNADSLFLLFGGPTGFTLEPEIAKLKGELEAVQEALIIKECGMKIVPVEEVIAKEKSGKIEPPAGGDATR